MAFINEMTILGNLGNQPELKYAESGRAYLAVNIATNESWKDPNTNEKQSRTTWHRVVFFDNKAELVAKYMDTGDVIWVRGPLRINQYTDDQAIQRQRCEVHAGQVKIIQTKNQNTNDNVTEE